MKINKKVYDKFAFKAPLAIEMYCDVNDINEEVKEEVQILNEKVKEYHMLNKKLYEERDNLVKKINDIIELIGEDKFSIYDDGNIEYNFNK